MTQTASDVSHSRPEPAALPPELRLPRLPWPLPVLGVLLVAAMAWVALTPPGATVRVGTADVEGGPGAARMAAAGTVVARTRATVAPRVAGRLTYLAVQEGAPVKRGQLLALIDDAEYRAGVLAARAAAERAVADLADAQRPLERAEWFAEHGTPPADLAEKRARVAVLAAALSQARAQAAVAQARYDRTRVRAPFDGTVLRLLAGVGEMVAPFADAGGAGRPAILELADLSTLEVEAGVAEAAIARLAPGLPARLVLDARPDTSIRGAVRQVGPGADRARGTVAVAVAILDRDPRILPGMAARVFFGPGDVAPAHVTVPCAALVETDGAARVWIVEQGRARARAVTPGDVRGERVEIAAGLAGGEVVIESPPDGLADGAPVRAAAR